MVVADGAGVFVIVLNGEVGVAVRVRVGVEERKINVEVGKRVSVRVGTDVRVMVGVMVRVGVGVAVGGMGVTDTTSELIKFPSNPTIFKR